MPTIGRVCIVVVATMVAVLVTEVFLTLIHYSYTPLRIETINKDSEWRYYHAFSDRHFVYHPELIWRPKNGTPPFNSQGYLGEELADKKLPEEFRIFAIGDSNTLGWMEEMDVNWPMFLEEILKAQNNRFTVINAGVYGYTSYQGLRRFKEALTFQPDMALISFGWNDALRVTISDLEFAKRKIRSLDLDMKFYQFRVGQLLLAFFDILLSSRDALVPRVSLEQYKDNLNEIIRLAKEKDIEVVLLTRPFTEESPSQTGQENVIATYNKATKEVAKSNDIILIDIFSYFENKEQCFLDECHFTKDCHRIAARLVYQGIRRLLPQDSLAAGASSR